MKTPKFVVKFTTNVKARSSEIFFGLGVISSVAALGLAAYEGIKIKQELDERKDKIAKLDDIYEEADAEDIEPETAKDITVKTAVKVAGRVLITAVPETLSILCFGKSNKIERNKAAIANLSCASIGALYAQTMDRFNKYRSNVINKYGPEVDAELYTSAVIEKVETELVDPATGEIAKTKGKALVATEALTDADISFFFEEGCDKWSDDPFANRATLKTAECVLTNRLIRDGVIFLNDIREYFGLPKTLAGQFNMLVYDPEHPENHQNRVNLGVFDNPNKNIALRRFHDGYESVVLISPIMDGVRLDEAREKGYLARC